MRARTTNAAKQSARYPSKLLKECHLQVPGRLLIRFADGEQRVILVERLFAGLHMPDAVREGHYTVEVTPHRLTFRLPDGQTEDFRPGECWEAGTPDDTAHEHLLSIVQKFPDDYEPYGATRRSSGDCSSGCRWYVVLAGSLGKDWGVCTNSQSHRCGLLTFEHQGCMAYEAAK